MMMEPAKTSTDVVCGTCRRQVSRYTCPSCNLCYCSLKCFRSESHSECSERFYRKEIEVGIKSESSKTAEDRNKMLELLKRIEDQSNEDENGLFESSDEETEEDSITRRFSGIDISSANADDLLRLLTAKERDAFFAALKDPSSGLARELLESAELEGTRQLPWWEASSDSGQPSLSIPYGAKPDPMAVPTNLIDQASRGVSLLYNTCTLLLAYTYVTRRLAVSPLASATDQDRRDACTMLSQSVPFLADRKSKLRHTSLTDVVISFWSRLDPASIDNTTMHILLEDVAKILRPRRITSECSSKEQEQSTVLAVDHPYATSIMAISDMSALFNASAAEHRGHTVMKLTFYAAHILSTPPSRLRTVADQVRLFAKSIGKEAS